jgi:hypothetical protein
MDQPSVCFHRYVAPVCYLAKVFPTILSRPLPQL